MVTATENWPQGLTLPQRVLKRGFDLVVSAFGLAAIGWLIALAALLARRDTGMSGLFAQRRMGRWGRPFTVYKIRTMRPVEGMRTNVTTGRDPRITPLGRFWRRSKIDELPQLINVFLGQMSFVGPRPDVPEVYGGLAGEDRVVLTVRPGITGPATLKYRREEELLETQEDPERYNAEVIFPDKVKINREYVENWSFLRDFGYILQTVLGR